jgi:hypothetical protein
MATIKVDEKTIVSHTETLSPTQTNDDFLEKLDRQPTFDYSGAHRKTDPKEIRLVKKLDWYIMPMSVYRVLKRIQWSFHLTCPQVVVYVLVELS